MAISKSRLKVSFLFNFFFGFATVPQMFPKSDNFLVHNLCIIKRNLMCEILAYMKDADVKNTVFQGKVVIAKTLNSLIISNLHKFIA